MSTQTIERSPKYLCLIRASAWLDRALEHYDVDETINLMMASATNE